MTPFWFAPNGRVRAAATIPAGDASPVLGTLERRRPERRAAPWEGCLREGNGLPGVASSRGAAAAPLGGCAVPGVGGRTGPPGGLMLRPRAAAAYHAGTSCRKPGSP